VIASAKRCAAEADLSAIVELDRACFGNPWTLEAYRQELYRPFAELWVVEEEAALVGLSCTWILGDEAHLLRIATRSDRRRRGLGRALLRSVIDRVTTAECRGLLLEVGASNRSALALYRTHGFEEVGRRRGYYRDPPDDALTLRRPLGLDAPAHPGSASRHSSREG